MGTKPRLATPESHLYDFNTAFIMINLVCTLISGIGVGMTRDCSTLMVAQYFKRKREFVEIFIVSGSGMGIAVMSTFIKGAIRYLYVFIIILRSVYTVFSYFSPRLYYNISTCRIPITTYTQIPGRQSDPRVYRWPAPPRGIDRHVAANV